MAVVICKDLLLMLVQIDQAAINEYMEFTSQQGDSASGFEDPTVPFIIS